MTDSPSDQAPEMIDRRQAEEFFRGLMEAAPDAMVIIDQQGLITMVNKQAENLFGYERTQLIGQSVDRLLPASLRAIHAEHRTTYLADPRTRSMGQNLALLAQRADGSEFPVEISLSPLLVIDQVYIISAIRDISERKRAEETFQGLIESAPDAVVIIDATGLIQIVNQQTEQLFGYNRTELLGQPLEILLPERFRGLHLHHRAGYIADPHTRPMGRNLDLVARHKNGTEIPVEISLSPLHTEKGLLITSSIRDITQQKRLAEELQRKNDALEEQYRSVQEANRLKSEFLANMSHELRPPLNAIIGFSELMHDGKVGFIAETHKEYLGDILTSSRHLMQLINDVLDLAKVEAGKIDLRPEPVDMEKLVSEVRDILRTLAAKKHIRVETQIMLGPELILLDPAKLKQVLYNYLSNAIKFTPEGGQVKISVYPEDEAHFRLEVSDTGIGIKEEDIKRLFIEFQQLDASTAKKYQGTGLGLALTRRIVEAQGGNVGVQSVPGRGSTFFVVLPRVITITTYDELQTTDDSYLSPSGVSVVLVIEDDAQDREWLNSILRTAGYSVESVTNGVEALTRCRTKLYQAIMLDLLLPDIDSRALLQSIRQDTLNSNTPVFIATIVAERAVMTGFAIQEFLQKPVQSKELLAALKRAAVQPIAPQTILVIDDDLATLNLVEATLQESGYNVIACESGERGLQIVATTSVDAIVLDLLMPEMDGFAFLQNYQEQNRSQRPPILIWTNKKLSPEEQSYLELHVQAILRKNHEGGTGTLVEELKRYVPTRLTNPQSTQGSYGYGG